MIILLILLCIVLFVLLFFSVKYNLKAGNQLRRYDDFYADTLDDIQESIVYLEGLMKREMVSEDPDVKNLRKLIGYVRNILVEYINVEKEKQKKEK